MSEEAVWKGRFAGYSPLELVDFAEIDASERSQWALEVLDEKLIAMGCVPKAHSPSKNSRTA